MALCGCRSVEVSGFECEGLDVGDGMYPEWPECVVEVEDDHAGKWKAVGEG